MKKIFSTLLLTTLLATNPAEAIKNKENKSHKDTSEKGDCRESTENCLGCGNEAQYAYFYITTPQVVPASAPPTFSSVNWSQSSNVTQDDIYLDPTDATKIVVKKPGIYDITYTVTAGQFLVQTALYLNGALVPGSIFPLWPLGPMQYLKLRVLSWSRLIKKTRPFP